VWSLFLLTYKTVVGRVGKGIKQELGVSFEWFEVLFRLYYAPEGRLRQHDLANALVLSRGRLSQMLSLMHKARLVYRQRSSKDRRGVYAVIAPAGRAIIEAGEQSSMQRVRERFVQYFSKADLATCEAIFSRILEAEKTPRPPRSGPKEVAN
jgi:DNA-binding MarR family transcriptional regulator